MKIERTHKMPLKRLMINSRLKNQEARKKMCRRKRSFGWKKTNSKRHFSFKMLAQQEKRCRQFHFENNQVSLKTEEIPKKRLFKNSKDLEDESRT